MLYFKKSESGLKISVACQEKKKSGERDALLPLNFHKRVGLAAAVFLSNGLQACCCKSKERMVGLSDSHSTGIWREEGRETAVCTKEKEMVKTARRDRFFAGVEIGIHRMSKKNLSEIFRIRFIEVVVLFVGSKQCTVAPKIDFVYACRNFAKVR